MADLRNDLRIRMSGAMFRPGRRGAVDRRPLYTIAGGVALASLLLLAIWQLGGEDTGDTRRERTVDLERIVIPTVPTRDELADPATSIDRDALAGLREGASVQVADENGRLAQEYGAARIDPLPDSWVEMDRPWARIHGSGGRLVEMQAVEGTMRVPDQALESGRLDGDVRIRLFESGQDPATSAPSVVITADDAEYDSGIGEIRSRRRVRVATADAVFVGEDLRIVLGDEGARIERLTVERALEPIRIQPGGQIDSGRADAVVRGSSTPDPLAAAGISDRVMASGDTPETSSRGTVPSGIGRSAPTDEDDPVYREAVYRLVLEDDVVIERRTLDADGRVQRSMVRGDRLLAFFQLGDQGEDVDLLSSGADRIMPPISVHSPTTMVAAGILTATHLDRSVEEDVVLVRYSGRLVMTPDPTAADRLRSSDDSVMIVEGFEGRGIEIEDEANDAAGQAKFLEYRTRDDRVELVGDEAHPLHLGSPRFTLDGGRFWFERTTGQGGLIGPGRMMLEQDASESLRAAVDGGVLGVDLMIDRMLADASSEASAALVSATLTALGTPIQDDPADAPPRLEIVWEGGVDLDFVEGTDARLQQARFNGDVKVVGDEFKLGSDSLVVDFDPTGEADAIDRILALGGARVDRVGENGSLEASQIDLGLVRTDDGRTIPSEMIARGEVSAKDPSQTLWTERLVVTFRESDGSTDRAERGLAGGLAGDVAGQPEMGDVEIHRLSATDAVQIRLDEGARVFADQLKGDAAAGLLELSGEDVMVLRGNVIADRMREVRLNDTARTVRSPGPGRFRYYDDPIVKPSEVRIERPNPTTRTSLAATWREAMAYRQAPDGETGRLDLEGDVRVRSTPDARTSDRLDARSVSLDLSHGAGGVRDREERGKADLLARRGDTSLERMVARGDAILESRTWEDDRKLGDPRLFRVTGDLVDYRVESGEALVEGAGGLLVHDPRPSGDRRIDAPVEAGFGVDGTTRFRWERRMSMNREIDGRYLVVMEQGVEVLHAGLVEQDTMTLTGDRLEVTLDRPDSDQPVKPRQAEGGIELGGPADIVRVRGMGRVFVRTPEHDVECEEFDYNVDTGIAMLRAAPGRVVTVQTKAATTPIRAERVLWDLRSGRLRILGGEGGISR
ncbi:MAG: hypothetical protein CMJ34_00500 [Phycisphaerae bacterium]|nr:hypothetical protein [Phycisphaerae bacterium]